MSQPHPQPVSAVILRHFQAARDAFVSGRFEAAINQWKQALRNLESEVNTQEARAGCHLQIGRSSLLLGQLDDARFHFEQAERLFNTSFIPSIGMAYARLGRAEVCLQQSEPDIACELSAQAMRDIASREEHPVSAHAYRIHAEALESLGAIIPAINAYNAARCAYIAQEDQAAASACAAHIETLLDAYIPEN